MSEMLQPDWATIEHPNLPNEMIQGIRNSRKVQSAKSGSRICIQGTRLSRFRMP